MAEAHDLHHILNTRAHWLSSNEAKQLRNEKSLVPRIYRCIHNDLHAECPAVPLLGYHTLRRTLNEFYPQRETLPSIDNLLFAIDLAADHPKAHPIERQLASLAMQAIELQKPFIREGLVVPERHLRVVT